MLVISSLIHLPVAKNCIRAADTSGRRPANYLRNGASMRRAVKRAAAAFSVGIVMGGVSAAAQEKAPSNAMAALVETERAFVVRAQQTNWRDAFLEYFAEGITGFDGEDIKARLRKRPAPPKELEFWWEPRYGDVAASGELGWLTGPVRTRLPQARGGQPDFANYTSVWRRQPDGSYKVIEDVGISTPGIPTFAPGFTRAPVQSRYGGPERGETARRSLEAADRALTASLRRSQAAGYAAAAAPYARLHRQRAMPIVGRDAIAAWARARPAWNSGETRLAVTADSGDLGYTRGAYSQAASFEAAAEAGHYLRIWSRDAAGQWQVVVDITQPKEQR
jgi:ketosteroid isomerase-like protein